MEYDKEKVDEMALALLYLTSFPEKYAEDVMVTRAWKEMAWEVMDRLYEKGYISDPKVKAKSVVMTDAGAALSQELFRKHFGEKEE